MSAIQCRLSEPYPEIKAHPNDGHDIVFLRPLYSGASGELTAILQYCYQHFAVQSDCSEVLSLLMDIAKVEMWHLELLADAIRCLGGNPKFVEPSMRRWWNASFVSYERSLNKALLHSLKCETDACRDYLAAAEKVSNPTLAALLRRIAADEKLHIKLLTELIECHCRKKA